MNQALREAREKKQMTLEAVADASGVSLRTYCRFEAGERLPRVDVALIIAAVLGSSVEKLWQAE